MVKNHLYSKSSQRPHTSAKENMIWVRLLYLDMDFGSGLLPMFNGDYIVQGYISEEIFMKIQSLSPEIEAKLWKNVLSSIIYLFLTLNLIEG